MKILCAFCLAMLSIAAFPHPGGGIIALSENSVIVADPTENFVRLLEKGKEPKRLVSKFHGHWMAQGLNGNLYVEAFQESGGAWSSAAFQFDLQSGKLTEVIHRDEIRALTFAVDRDGSLVFQRGSSLVSRANGKESPFRPSSNPPMVGKVTAYAWAPDGELLFSDQNQIRRIDRNGVASLVAKIEGKFLEPNIWNVSETPTIFSLAIDDKGSVLAALPDLGKVYRVDKNGKLHEIAHSEDGWRATGVATFGDAIFLSESDSRASASPRVRIVRSNGTVDLLTIPPPSR
ncbi:MAG: hypothetical protein FJ403_17480 [Verrucomicrobia bacterium]|nr:hypothetical protein [Verrucomicrobiota bacterium]